MQIGKLVCSAVRLLQLSTVRVKDVRRTERQEEYVYFLLIESGKSGPEYRVW
jgi:hypothetical protein